MRQLNLVEVNAVAGGLDHGKPVLQANLSDVVEGFCVWTGMNAGWTLGKGQVGETTLSGYGSTAAGVGGAFAGAVTGGVVAHVALRVVPAVTGMVTNVLPV